MTFFRWHVLLTDLVLALRTDPLALIRGTTEFVTTIYGLAVTFAFPDVNRRSEAYRMSVCTEPHFSSGREHTQLVQAKVLREVMSEELLLAKIAETKITTVNF